MMEKIKSFKWRFFIFYAGVLLFLGGVGLTLLLPPDETYSAAERRMLTERPSPDMEALADGSFQEAGETFLAEQFPARAHWVTAQTKLEQLMGKREANGVYFGADGYLLEKYTEQEIDWKQAKRNLKRLSKFLAAYPQAQVMFVPTKSDVLSEKLPPFAGTGAEARFWEMAEAYIAPKQRIDVADILRAHDSEYIYYRTDHHWTTLGAYYAYTAWAEKMGIAPLRPEQFTVTQVSDSFLGTTYAKVRTGGRADSISLYEAKNRPAYAIDYNMGEFQSDSLYDMECLSGDDPYSVFLGGNQALVDIRSDAQENGKTLLLVKDSFGNCFVPFAALHYARTVVLDMRNVNIPVGKLLQAYPADDILILYNDMQFMESTDISKLK